MRHIFAPVCKFVLSLSLVNGLACTKARDSDRSLAKVAAQPGQGSVLMPAASLDTNSLERRVREIFLVTLSPYCDTELKKIASTGTSELSYSASISCEHRQPYRSHHIDEFDVSTFFSLIDSLHADLAALQTRSDATIEQKQMVEAFDEAFRSKSGVKLIETKIAFENDLRARTAMLAKMNMKITRHAGEIGKPAHDTVEWIENASHNVLIADGINEVCAIQAERPEFNGESFWLTKSEAYTSAHRTARLVAENVFASVGADTTFVPAGDRAQWSITSPKEFLKAYFWWGEGSDLCSAKPGVAGLDKMVSMIKGGEFARQWAALPKVSSPSVIRLHSRDATLEPDGILTFAKMQIGDLAQPFEGRLFALGFTIEIPRKNPSRALEYAAAAARQGFESMDEALKLQGDYQRVLREAAPTRKDYAKWPAIEFVTLGKSKVYVADFAKEVKVARERFATVDQWLPGFLNWDTINAARDYEFNNCRRGNFLPLIKFNIALTYSKIDCVGTQMVYFINK